MQFQTLNGHLIAYRHRPSLGTTIVFVNSLGSDQSIWDGVRAGLGRGVGTLTYDLRGHGLSGVPAGPYTIDDMADDLIALLDHLQLTRVYLCGISVGGMIAQAVAAKRPALLQGLILSNTAAKIGSNTRWQDRIANVNARGLTEIAGNIVDLWLAPAFISTHHDAVAGARNMLMRTPPAGYVATCEAIRDADLTAQTNTLALPALCIAGSEDQSVRTADMEALIGMINGARLEVLSDVGHLPCLEAPSRMAALIRNFIQRPTNRHDTGMAVRRAVLGDAHVDRAEANTTAFDAAFQDLITEGAWGTVWASDNISYRERSMITLALLAALGNFDEIHMHIRATARTGATATDIQEVFQHVAIYAGVPRANHALKLAKKVLAEMDEAADG